MSDIHKNIENPEIIAYLLDTYCPYDDVACEECKFSIVNEFGQCECDHSKFKNWLLSEYEEKDALEKLGYTKSFNHFNNTYRYQKYNQNYTKTIEIYKNIDNKWFVSSNRGLSKQDLKVIGEIIQELEEEYA